jgi:hypothetical protein
MNPTRGQAQILIDKLEKALQRCERVAGLKNLDLTLQPVTPGGSKVGTEVTFKPTPNNTEALNWAVVEVTQAVAAFEDETECWVETVFTAWTSDEPPRRFLRCTFRAAY